MDVPTTAWMRAAARWSHTAAARCEGRRIDGQHGLQRGPTDGPTADRRCAATRWRWRATSSTTIARRRATAAFATTTVATVATVCCMFVRTLVHHDLHNLVTKVEGAPRVFLLTE